MAGRAKAKYPAWWRPSRTDRGDRPCDPVTRRRVIVERHLERGSLRTTRPHRMTGGGLGAAQPMRQPHGIRHPVRGASCLNAHDFGGRRVLVVSRMAAGVRARAPRSCRRTCPRRRPPTGRPAALTRRVFDTMRFAFVALLVGVLVGPLGPQTRLAPDGSGIGGGTRSLRPTAV